MRKKNLFLKLGKEDVTTQEPVTNLEKEELPMEVLVSKIRENLEDGTLPPIEGFDISEDLKQAILETDGTLSNEDSVAVESFVNRVFSNSRETDLEVQIRKFEKLFHPEFKHAELYVKKIQELYQSYRKGYNDNGATFAFRYSEFQEINVLSKTSDFATLKSLISTHILKGLTSTCFDIKKRFNEASVEYPYDIVYLSLNPQVIGINGPDVIYLRKRDEKTVSFDLEHVDNIRLLDDGIAFEVRDRTRSKALPVNPLMDIGAFTTFIQDAGPTLVNEFAQTGREIRAFRNFVTLSLLEKKYITELEKEQALILSEEFLNILTRTIATINDFYPNLIKALCDDNNIGLSAEAIIAQIESNTD